MKKNHKPNFLIAGTAKSGTTALHYYLQQHPEIYMPTRRKELRFFSEMSGQYNGVGDEIYRTPIAKSFDDYLTYYEEVKREKRIGESSPDYLFHYGKSIENIKKYLGDPKIIIILRNPTARAYSHYLMYVRDERETLSFEEALAQEEQRKRENWEWGWLYKEVGLYYSQVKAYIDNFSDVRVYKFEDLKNNSASLLGDLYSFLEVDTSFIPRNLQVQYNVSGIPKRKYIQNFLKKPNTVTSILKPMLNYCLPETTKEFMKNSIHNIKRRNMIKIEMSLNEKNFLNEYYKEDVNKLRKLINDDLPDWLV